LCWQQVLIYLFLLAANITGHYMAKGKRVLITSKSSEALKVISDKIGGKNGVFEDGSYLKKLIFSWGDQKKAYKSFESAAETLTELCGELEQEDEIAENLKKRERLSKKISDIENRFETTSTFAFKTLEELSTEVGHENPELVDMSKMITSMCKQDNGLDELCHKTARGLADSIRNPREQGELDVFSSFVSFDLEQAFKTKNGRDRLVAWFESAGKHRDHVQSLREGSSVSTTKEDSPTTEDSILPKDILEPAVGEKRKTGIWESASCWVGQFFGKDPKDQGPHPLEGSAKRNEKAVDDGLVLPSGKVSSVESETAELKLQLERAGLKTWAHEILKVIRCDKEVDAVIPRKWQRYLRLVCCRIFLEHLWEKLPRACMVHLEIEERTRLEKDRQGAFKAVVGKETLRHAVTRQYLPGFSRNLASFISTYQKASKMLGKTTTKKSPVYYNLQHSLQTMMQDGKLLDALPVWIMPTDIVSEMLPATFGLFDVVILEEASQSNCLAIPALLRGKKLIVIGDEKQVNPPASTEAYKQFISRNLGSELPKFTSDNLMPGKSVFDLFATAFKGRETTVVLREHFRSSPNPFHFVVVGFVHPSRSDQLLYCRCLPEIIGFCNELCYDNRLVPLTESDPSYGPAVQHEWVPDGLCVGSGVKLRNEQEAKAIVRRVRIAALIHLFIFALLFHVCRSNISPA